jgi:hypothetical protein
MSKIKTRSDYLALFKDPAPSSGEASVTAPPRQVEALKTALDIRKFEIELYWKRATYFWTFIAASLAGYFLLQQRANDDSFDSTYVVTCLGFVFSLAWYFVNRGSKSWQRNWEIQVDLLEDEVMGPLYKTGLNRYATEFSDITAGYPFSPSNINQLLGLFVTVVWLGLIARTIMLAHWCHASHFWTAWVMSILTVLTCVAFWVKGRTTESDQPYSIHHRARSYFDSDPK